MKRFPSDFADMLTRKGRRILEGRVPDLCGVLGDPARPFVAVAGAIEAEKARAAHALLDRTLRAALVPLEAPIPPGSIWNQTRNYQERLPKTARMRTAYLERRGRAFQAAEAIGLLAMMRSDSFRAFAQTVSGRTLAPEFGQQVLCYGAGDYAGPHTDHHPEDPRSAGGYVDMHVSFGHGDVASQYLVYAPNGHFTEMVNVNTPGGITVYRLPFWHYTTPLQPQRGREAKARRWVVLGTFLYADPLPAPVPGAAPYDPLARGRQA